MSEKELLELKEQIKKELISEMNTKKENESNWKKIKEEYKEDFSKFDFIDHWEFINANNELISKDEKISTIYPLQNAIGTLLRIVYKSRTVNKINAEYEEMKEIVEKILNILKKKAGVKNEML